MIFVGCIISFLVCFCRFRAKVSNYHHYKNSINILLLIRDHGFDGVVIAFENWPDIKAISEYLRTLRTALTSFPFIIVGGVQSTQDAKQLIAAGASLVQIYTSLVQQGPLQTRKLISNFD